MKRLWLILLIVSCTTAPKMDYDGMAEQTQEKKKPSQETLDKVKAGEERLKKWKADQTPKWTAEDYNKAAQEQYRKQGITYTIPFNYQYIKNTDYYHFYDTKTELYPNGVIKEKYTLRDGKKWGVQTSYYPNGSLKWKEFNYRLFIRGDTNLYTAFVGFTEKGEIYDSPYGGLFNNKPVDFDKLINNWKKLEIKDGEGFYDGKKIMFVDYDYIMGITEDDKEATRAQAKAFNLAGYTLSNLPDSLIDFVNLSPLAIPFTNIAVMDFNGNNISDGEVRALTDRLRAELFKTKHFKVIEREMMQEVLKEQGFQQSGCTTDKCMVRIGRLVGVEKIIGGSISKVGNVYSVSSRIVNVETGEIEKSEIYDHMGDIGQLLTNGMRMVAIGLTK